MVLLFSTELLIVRDYELKCSRIKQKQKTRMTNSLILTFFNMQVYCLYCFVFVWNYGLNISTEICAHTKLNGTNFMLFLKLQVSDMTARLL